MKQFKGIRTRKYKSHKSQRQELTLDKTIAEHFSI